MTIEQAALALCCALIGVYRDEVKAFNKARWNAFWTARQADMQQMRRRHLAPGGKDFNVPNPLDREARRTLLVAAPCLAAIYAVQYSASQDLRCLTLAKVAAAIAGLAFARLILIQSILTPYRFKLLLELVTQAQTQKRASESR